MSKWFNTEADLKLDDKASLSDRLAAGLGAWGFSGEASSVGVSDDHAKLERVMRKLARTVNIVTTKGERSDLNLKLGWSDGDKKNQLNEKTIYLSPDSVLKQGESPTVIDALTGQVLLASAMKRTVSPAAWLHATTDKATDAPSSKTVWKAMETAIARGELLQDWQGFAPYIARHERDTCSSKAQVQAALKFLPPSVGLAADALAWNILHPSNPLSLPKPYVKGVNAAMEFLSEAKLDKKKRYQLAQQAVGLLELDTTPPDSGSGEGDPQPGGESGDKDKPGKSGKDKPEGKSDDKDKGDPKKDEPKDKPEGDESKDESKGKDDGEKPEDKPKDEGDKGDDKPEGDKPEKPEDKGEDDGDGDGDGEGDEPELDGPPDGPINVTDGDLYGDQVESSTEDVPEPVECHKLSSEDTVVGLPPGCDDVKFTHVSFVQLANPARYEKESRRLRTYINAVSEALRFRNNDPTQFIRGVHSGDLDDGSLDKLCLHESNPAIWERREIAGQPKVAVGLLIDESGSMSGGGRIAAARDVTLTMTAAIKRIRGIDLMVLGHTSGTTAETPRYGATVKCTGKDGHYSLLMSEYLTVKHTNPHAVTCPRAIAGNADGHAMNYSVRKMIADYPTHTRRVLFVISDGCPSADGSMCYFGPPAMNHMRQVCEFGRRNNISVYGIGICNAYDNAFGDGAYGHGNYVVIRDVMSSLPILTAYLRNVAARPA